MQMVMGISDQVVVLELRSEDRRGHAGRGVATTRSSSRPTSGARRMSDARAHGHRPQGEACALRPGRRCCTASTSWSTTARSSCSSARTAPARRRRCGRSAAWSTRRARCELDGAELVGKATDWIVRRGVAHVPQGRGTFPELTVEDNLQAGAYIRKDTRGLRTTSSAGSRCSRGSASGAASAGRQPERRRAADARRRPGADVPAEAAAARRAVARAGADAHAGAVPATSPSSNREFGTTMFLVEQNAEPRARHRQPGLRARSRPHRARPARPTSCATTTTSARPTWGSDDAVRIPHQRAASSTGP